MLRIHLILMRIRDSHWKKIDSDPDPGFFHKLTDFFLQSRIFRFLSYFCSLIFMLKLNEPFRNQEIFIISLFFQYFRFGVSIIFLQFLLIYCPLDPDPWIRIFIRIQEAKILRIQRIWILSTASGNTQQGFLRPLFTI